LRTKTGRISMEANGWLLDLYDQPQEGVVLWLIADSGQRLRLHQPFPITFYAAGPEQRLLALQKFLHSQPVSLVCGAKNNVISFRRSLWQHWPSVWNR
jgi:hypothetical protein